MDAGPPRGLPFNGVEADNDDLKLPARANYAHFTSMQARDGAVRGLDLHLKRLDDSTRELFGTGLDPDRVRACLRHALRASPDAVTARVTVFSRRQDAVLRGEHTEPDLAVTTTAPLDARTSPVRLRTTTYERDLPHVKHSGTFGLSLRRRAVLDGYDDVLFTDRDGRISEASISPAVPVARIDETALTVDPDVTALLVKCYESNPWQPL
ncbi:aminotransferase class IV [Streptomyces sp. LaBMicrA B280]|uniref:aminotransferase class IV n=1 Tax=Streptomyces sp. LaBMicrA B280 TaxID=3391001 RepID=UPI003BA4B3F8